MTRYQRPGRRPGFNARRQDVVPVLAAVVVCGLVVLRWVTGVTLIDAAQTVEEEKRLLEAIEREVDRERVEVEQAIALARLEPRARAAGLARVAVDAVNLLASSEPARVPDARPLGAPGAGARGSWFERVWSGARVTAAAAAEKERGEAEAAAASQAASGPAARAGSAAHAAVDHCVDRCSVCQARAAKQHKSQ